MICVRQEDKANIGKIKTLKRNYKEENGAGGGEGICSDVVAFPHK